MASLNTINYSVIENKMRAPNSPAFLARVHRFKRVTQDELIQLMEERNNMMSGDDIKAVLGLFQQVVTSQLLRGNSISTDLFKARVSIKGGFDSRESEFDPGRNRITPRFSSGAKLAKQIANGRIERIRDVKPLPAIDSIQDYKTGTTNTAVSPGFTAEVKGLNFNFETQAQGLYFVNTETDEEVKVTRFIKSKNNFLVFTVPAFTASGSYTLEARSAFGAATRTSSLEGTLTVSKEENN